MAYEIDFIGVSDSEAKQDADAIVIRWNDGGNYKIVVYDGGLQPHGEKLKEHLNQYYFDDYDEKVIDAVIASHSDKDHTSGLKVILGNFQVNALYMNRPWSGEMELYYKIRGGRITWKSLVQHFKDSYSYVDDLENIAKSKGIPVYDVFKGDMIEGVFRVLSPSRDFYLEMIEESYEASLKKSAGDGVGVLENARDLLETWNKETLHEDVTTSAENEMSVVLYGNMGNEGILLVGDAGRKALSRANSFAEAAGISLKDDVKFMQIPHHGGRHNVSTSLLNDIVGTIVRPRMTTGKVAYVCAAEKSDHPLQMVVNAYIRRGVKVYAAKGRIIHYNVGMPKRDGERALTQEKFNCNVEKWD